MVEYLRRSDDERHQLWITESEYLQTFKSSNICFSPEIPARQESQRGGRSESCIHSAQPELLGQRPHYLTPCSAERIVLLSEEASSLRRLFARP